MFHGEPTVGIFRRVKNKKKQGGRIIIKRIWVVRFLILFVFILAGCNEDEKKERTTTTEASEKHEAETTDSEPTKQTTEEPTDETTDDESVEAIQYEEHNDNDVYTYEEYIKISYNAMNMHQSQVDTYRELLTQGQNNPQVMDKNSWKADIATCVYYFDNLAEALSDMQPNVPEPFLSAHKHIIKAIKYQGKSGENILYFSNTNDTNYSEKAMLYVKKSNDTLDQANHDLEKIIQDLTN